MKTVLMVLLPVLVLGAALHAENGGPGPEQASDPAVVNDIVNVQNQDLSVVSVSEGGSSWSDSQSKSSSNANANVNLDASSVSNYESLTQPLTSFPPYLPAWNHGGWGIVKAYFANGPTVHDRIYETTFDPENPDDVRELRSVLKALPYDGLLAAAGGVLNSVAVALFGAPDAYHRGRGFEIANAVVRDRRPEGKPLLVFIDSSVDPELLRQEGYAYMGKISIEAAPDRNWDHAYKAAVSEALLWDVDILLVSGGMKGVTVGENVTFPSGGIGFSENHYSLSLMGGKASGVTEGKGKAVLSAEAYRFLPDRAERRKIPAALYDRIRRRPQPVISRRIGQEDLGFDDVESTGAEPEYQPLRDRRLSRSRYEGLRGMSRTPSNRDGRPGIAVRRELLDMAGFDASSVGNVAVR